MKIIFPQNIFAKLIADNLPEGIKKLVSYNPSPVISNELKNQEESIGLIPVMDLISHHDLFISSRLGMSFEGLLCNSYIYYNPDQNDIKDLYLYGDISSQEAILSKIIFKELYDTDIEIHLLTDNNFENKNLVISGDQNFADSRFLRGISLADEVIESLNMPYVNYVFASGKKELIEELHLSVTGLGEKIYTGVESHNFGESLPELSKDYITSNISSLIVDFDQQDLEGLGQLVQLPYFYGMIKDMIEIKYV